MFFFQLLLVLAIVAGGSIAGASRLSEPIRRLRLRTGKQVPAGQVELLRRLPFYHTGDHIRQEASVLTQSCKGAAVTMEQWPMAHNHTGVDDSLDVITVRPLARSPKVKATLRGSEPRDVDAVPAEEVASSHRQDGLRAMLVFGEHARELISPESGLHFLRALCSGQHFNLNKVSEIKIILNANPQSRKLVEGGDFCRRTNEDDVDLNRNWANHFSTKAASHETAPGPRPFSEPESRALRDIAAEFQPGLFLTVHSGALLLGSPFGYMKDAPPLANQQMLRVLRPISEKYCQCPFGSLGRIVGYDSPGNSIDYAYQNLGIPFTFTWEIYANEAGKQYFQESLSRAQSRETREAPLHEYTKKLEEMLTHSSSQSSQTRRPKAQKATWKTSGRMKPVPRKNAKALLLTPAHSSVDHASSSGALVKPHHMTPDECLEKWNPTDRQAYDALLEKWTAAYAELLTSVSAELDARRDLRPLQKLLA